MSSSFVLNMVKMRTLKHLASTISCLTNPPLACRNFLLYFTLLALLTSLCFTCFAYFAYLLNLLLLCLTVLLSCFAFLLSFFHFLTLLILLVLLCLLCILLSFTLLSTSLTWPTLILLC